MTSGEFTHFPAEKISVNRASRQRREISQESIDSLADSIARQGLIHAIVIRRSGDLIVGETRLAAMRKLGWEKIPVQFIEDLDEARFREVELEENVKRKDLPWQDQCNAIAELHELYKEREESWTVLKTSEALGISKRVVEENLQVAREIRQGDEMVAQAPAFSTAKGIAERKKERQRADEEVLLEDSLPVKPNRKFSDVIRVADFNEWVKTYDGPPFNFVHCDFPYGVGADKFNQGAAKSFGGYSDTEEGYWRLVASLLNNTKRLLGESAHLIFWFSPKHYAKTLEALRSKFWVDEYPLVWNKVNVGIIPDPKMGPRRIYEMAFFCSWGKRPIIRAVPNLFTGTVLRTGEHMSEKSQEMLQHFFAMFVDEGTRMLDPTCGSGSSLRAAISLKARSVLGLEVNSAFADNARLAIRRLENGST